MSVSGICGEYGVLSSVAKMRVEKNMFNGCTLQKGEDGWVVLFLGENAEWKGRQLFLTSTRAMLEPKVFKTLDAAYNAALNLGLNDSSIQVKSS
jgi:hypothetical protein